MDSLSTFLQAMRPALEQALQEAVRPWQEPPLLGAMVQHHFGWQDPKARRGKRVRPFLLLLSHEAAGGNWRQALPAAVAVELIHNFSLIHDDIQDQSPTRRGRETVWHRWGAAQAINAGDALFALAFAQMGGLEAHFPPARVVEAVNVLARACLALVQGQVLDLAFEDRDQVTLEAYWRMVRGKTAALLTAATDLAALLAGVDAARRQAFRTFGERLGMAFQVWDDYLGIWGDPARTGKPVADDILARKKSFPVLYGLARPESPFAQRWQDPAPFTPEEARQMARWLEAMGGKEYTLQTTRRLTQEALDALRQARPQEPAASALEALALSLVGRQT